MKNLTKTTKTVLFASLIITLILPFSSMDSASARPLDDIRTDINYNDDTNEITIQWDLLSNPDRQLQNGNQLCTSVLTVISYDEENIGYSFFIQNGDIISNAEWNVNSRLIDCSGTMIVDLDNYSEINPNHFKFLMSFYEIIDEAYKSNYDDSFSFDGYELHELYGIVFDYSNSEPLPVYGCDFFSSPAPNLILGIDPTGTYKYFVTTDNCLDEIDLLYLIFPNGTNPQGLDVLNIDEDAVATEDAIATTSTETKKKSAGTCSDCTAPDILLENEIVQNTEINQPNTISFSSWETRGPYYIQFVEIGLGVKDIETPIEDSQARIQVWMGYWLYEDIPLVKEIKIIDPDGILVSDTVISITLDRECENPPCLDLEFNYTYAKEPIYDGIIINTSDFYKNTVTNYYFN